MSGLSFQDYHIWRVPSEYTNHYTIWLNSKIVGTIWQCLDTGELLGKISPPYFNYGSNYYSDQDRWRATKRQIYQYIQDDIIERILFD